MSPHDIIIVGGVAGLSAGVFTARHGLDTLTRDGVLILRWNTHLENDPGVPTGVNARLLLDMMGDQADRAGCNQQTKTSAKVGRVSHERWLKSTLPNHIRMNNGRPKPARGIAPYAITISRPENTA